MEHYCTYFDLNYVSRGIALYRSLLRTGQPFCLWILCLDESTSRVLSLMGLDRARLVFLSELEDWDRALIASKSKRSRVEYYFTLTPSFILYLLDRISPLHHITYLDADLAFFSSPSPVFEALEDGSILIVGHRFPENLRHLEVYGVYNVGLLTFRGDYEGRRCLEWWRERCLEWCFDRAEDGRYADQKYLDDWPDRFENVVVLDHPGAGLAPWNQARYRKWVKEGHVMVEGKPLLFYHFHGMKRINRWFYSLGMGEYGRPSPILRRFVYIPTIREMVHVEREISNLIQEKRPLVSTKDIRHVGYRSRSILRGFMRKDLAITIGKWVF